MAGETKVERRLDTWVDRATTPRGAAIVIATASIAVTIAAGILMRLAEGSNYPSIGSGLWWAVQTVTTVGYGDNVPTSVAGRLVAALVMFFGIGFLTVITAAITSTFIASQQVQAAADSDSSTSEQLHEIDRRLERIEAALTGSSAPE